MWVPTPKLYTAVQMELDLCIYLFILRKCNMKKSFLKSKKKKGHKSIGLH